MENYYSCDPTAMVVALDPTAVVKSETHYCSVELQGNYTRGQMVVDWRGISKRTPNVQIITDVDIQKIMKYYEAMLV